MWYCTPSPSDNPVGVNDKLVFSTVQRGAVAVSLNLTISPEYSLPIWQCSSHLAMGIMRQYKVLWKNLYHPCLQQSAMKQNAHSCWSVAPEWTCIQSITIIWLRPWGWCPPMRLLLEQHSQTKRQGADLVFCCRLDYAPSQHWSPNLRVCIEISNLLVQKSSAIYE